MLNVFKNWFEQLVTLYEYQQSRLLSQRLPNLALKVEKEKGSSVLINVSKDIAIKSGAIEFIEKFLINF